MKTAFRLQAAAGIAALALALPALAQTPPAPETDAPLACTDMQLEIYFPPYETALNMQSERVIDAASEMLKGCYVTALSLNALSEEAHTDEDAAEMSETRLHNVMSALLDHGIEPAAIKTDYSRIEAEAPSAAPMAEPMARRVSVSLEVRDAIGVT